LKGKAVASAALAAAVVLAAGCGGGSPPRTTTQAVSRVPKCTLSARQRRLIRRAKRMIVRMHRLEQPLKTVHKQGPLKLELLLNRFLLSIGVLPVDERGLLIRKAKSAVGLCQDCFDALEALEPSLQTKLGESPCKPGF
jgi:hypothetical protein